MTTRLKPLLIAILLTAGVAAAADDTKSTSESVMAVLKSKYPKTTFKSVAETHLPGIYEVEMGKNVAYIEKEGRYFLFGHLFDMETQKDLTEEKFPREASANEGNAPGQASAKIDVGLLPVADAIKQVRGAGERKIYVFSDPDCPYCKQLEGTLASIENVTIHTFMFPIDSLHPEAKRKAVGVWCSKDKAKAWDDLTRRGIVQSGACDNPIDRNVALAEKLGINGTPTIILADGTLIPGAVPAARLNQLLAANKK